MGEINHRGAFIFGLVVGAAGGALSTLFMTPKSGSQIREQIKGQTEGVQQRLTTATSGVLERADDVQQRLATATTGVRDRADDVIGASMGKVTQLTQRGRDVADDVVEMTKPGSPASEQAPTPINTTDVTGAANAVEHQEPSASTPS